MSEAERISKWYERIASEKKKGTVINKEGLVSWLRLFNDEEAQQRFESAMKINGVLTIRPRQYVYLNPKIHQ